VSWINEVVRSTEEAESPLRFQYWAALAALSASLKRNVYLDRHYYKLFPNLYILLVGKSGLRKGNPTTLAKKLAEKSGQVRIIAGRNSIQAILKELGKSYSIEGGGVQKNADCFIVSGELDSLFVKDPDAMTVLTDLYDTHAHDPIWKNTLKTGGVDTLKLPYITLLGGTNEEHFKGAVADKDIRGGFIARTLIVYENQRRTINDLMDPPKIVPNIDELSCILKEAAKLVGFFKVDDDAKELYRDWYHRLSTEDHDDRTGTIERLGDTVLKVAICLSVAHDMTLVIKPDQMNEAIFRCTECLVGLKHVVMGSGAGEVTLMLSRIIKYLVMRPEHIATKSQILSKFWQDGLDSIMLDRIVETLDQSGAIDIELRGKTVFYKMRKQHVEAYTRFKMEIQ